MTRILKMNDSEAVGVIYDSHAALKSSVAAPKGEVHLIDVGMAAGPDSESIYPEYERRFHEIVREMYGGGSDEEKS